MDNIEKRAYEYACRTDYLGSTTFFSDRKKYYKAGATEQKAIDDALIKKLFEKAWSLADSMYQVGKDHLTPLTHQEFIKEMEDIARALDK